MPSRRSLLPSFPTAPIIASATNSNTRPEAAQNWPPASPGPEPRPKAAGARTSQRVYEQKAATPRPTEQAAPGAPQHKTSSKSTFFRQRKKPAHQKMKRGVDGAARNTRGRSKRQPPQQSWSTPTNGQAPAAAARRFFPRRRRPMTSPRKTARTLDGGGGRCFKGGRLALRHGRLVESREALTSPHKRRATKENARRLPGAVGRRRAPRRRQGALAAGGGQFVEAISGEVRPKKRWALIASHIPGRAGKQCRERWLNHLDSRVVKSDWTPDEDAILLDAQQRVGNKWSEIARGLPGRAENAVKNRFNSLITKRLTHGLEAQAREGTASPKVGEKPTRPRRGG